MKPNVSQLYYFGLTVAFFLSRHMDTRPMRQTKASLTKGKTRTRYHPRKHLRETQISLSLTKSQSRPLAPKIFVADAKASFVVLVPALATPTLQHHWQPIGAMRMKAAGQIHVKQNLPLQQNSKSDMACQIRSFSTIPVVSHGSHYRIFIGILWSPMEAPAQA